MVLVLVVYIHDQINNTNRNLAKEHLRVHLASPAIFFEKFQQVLIILVDNLDSTRWEHMTLT